MFFLDDEYPVKSPTKILPGGRKKNPTSLEKCPPKVCEVAVGFFPTKFFYQIYPCTCYIITYSCFVICKILRWLFTRIWKRTNGNFCWILIAHKKSLLSWAEVEPVSQTIFPHNSNLMETSSCNSITGHQITTIFCTWHDSTTVVSCAKFCGNHFLQIALRAKQSFHWIWISVEKALWKWTPGGRFRNVFELLNLRALKISMLYKNHIFQCMGKIFCVAFQRVPLKFHTKYLTHTLKDVDFIHRWKIKSA